MKKRFKVGDWVYLNPWDPTIDRLNKAVDRTGVERGVVTSIIRDNFAFQDVTVVWEDGRQTGTESDWLLLV